LIEAHAKLAVANCSQKRKKDAECNTRYKHMETWTVDVDRDKKEDTKKGGKILQILVPFVITNTSKRQVG
jgi:hypothetical protein